MTKAVADFIEALLVHYPVRHDTEEREDAWVNSMTIALKGFGPSILDEVAAEIIRTRKYRNFPLLSEILDKCDDVEQRREAAKREGLLPEFRPQLGDEWTTERCRLAYDLVKSGMGRQAAKDNPCWILALWHFCRRNQRPPAGPEIEQCKRDASAFDEAYDKCLRGEAGPHSQKWERVGDAMVAKRKKLVDEVLGR